MFFYNQQGSTILSIVINMRKGLAMVFLATWISGEFIESFLLFFYFCCLILLLNIALYYCNLLGKCVKYKDCKILYILLIEFILRTLN